MGQRGPAKKPTALRVLHGDRKDRINTNEPIPQAGAIKRPSWLPKSAHPLWKELAPQLIARGVLTPWDVELFARFCWLSVKNRELIKIIETEGTIIRGDHGVRVKHPAMQLIRDTNTQMISIGGKFGLTPSDRANMSMPEKEPDDAEGLLS